MWRPAIRRMLSSIIKAGSHGSLIGNNPRRVDPTGTMTVVALTGNSLMILLGNESRAKGKEEGEGINLIVTDQEMESRSNEQDKEVIDITAAT